MAEGRNSGLYLVIGLGAAYAGYKLFLQPNVIEPARLKAYTQRIRVNMPTVRFKGDNVEFDVYVQNPNPNPLTINAIVGDVFISYQGKNIKLGNVDRYGDVVLKPMAETKYSFSVRLKLIPMVQYFNDILAGKARGQVVTFIGTITINKRPWPLKEVVKL